MTTAAWISGHLVFPQIRSKLKNNFAPGSLVAVSLSSTLPCVGTLCKVLSPGTVEGISRIRLEFLQDKDGSVRYTVIPDMGEESVEDEVFEITKKLSELMNKENLIFPKNAHPQFIGYIVMATLLRVFAPTGVLSLAADGQAVLEQVSLAARLKQVVSCLDRCAVAESVNRSIRDKQTSEVKQVLIRRQIAELEKQLIPANSELGDLKSKGAKISNVEILKIFNREMKRLENIPPHHPEHHGILNYLETIVALPKTKSVCEKVDLKTAKKILDKSHFGLEKVKQRIIEHLAVSEKNLLNNVTTATVICLSGPPGLGKTTIASAIADAMSRKFVRISLSGLRDESELRGHRRTYIGAMPGLLVQALIRSGVANPVILLDEVDKVGGRHNLHGDASGVLLEILDGSQNKNFRDAYLNFGIDLSECVFICTCNDPTLLSRPLADRLELLELEPYSEEEKVAIAKQFLVPKHDVCFSNESTIRRIIHDYTMEAGVRDLDRKMAQISRFIILKNFTENPQNSENIVSETMLLEILGPPSVSPGALIPSVLPVGVSLGLAVTALGGEVLFIEAIRTTSSKMLVTGQLGEVMQESVRIALSLLSLQPNIHIHFPSGAVRKDGPSAGVATWIALASLLYGIAAPASLAATGEITLRGAVLPVGGVKAKIIAAHQAGIKTVIIPSGNKACLSEIPTNITNQINVVPVDSIDQVCDIAFPNMQITVSSAKL